MYHYLDELWKLFMSMSFYMVIGLLCTGFLHAFVKDRWIKNQLGSQKASSLVKASLVGVPLPLCSCGVVPMAVYLRQSGASKGAVMSFLTSTPQTGVDSIIATYGLMGPIFAVFRPFAAFASGVITGLVTNLLNPEEKACCCGKSEPEPKPAAHSCCCGESKPEPKPATHSCCCGSPEKELEEKQLSFIQKIVKMFTFAFGEFLGKIALNFVIGLLIAALISTLLPADLLATIQNPFIAMLLVLVVGIPMYVCSTASIPIAVALMMKGLSPGTAFVFLFTGPATNMASIAVLMKAFDKKTILTYILTLSACAICFGLLLDYVAGNAIVTEVQEIHCDEHSLLYQIVAVGFGILLALSLLKKYRKKAA